jgi:hypothetical protein
MSRQAEYGVIGEVLWALKRAVCVRLGAYDGCRVKLMSQQASLC